MRDESMSVNTQFLATVYKKGGAVVKDEAELLDIDENTLGESAEAILNRELAEAFKTETKKKEFVLPGAENKKIKKTKQTSCISPNVIHSFDAAHMQLTVLRLAKDYNIKSFSLIHDSYGTHACDVDVLQKVLREEFVKMYSVDRLAEIKDCFNAQLASKGVQIEADTAAMRGDFDITEVFDSEYFFA